MRDFEGKLALVTGAGSGIGRATARALASGGARLIAIDVAEERLQALADELGESCLVHKTVDVSDREAMRRLAEDVHARFGALDLLVNNAGVTAVGGLCTTPLNDFDWILGINLMGVVHGCQLFVPAMVERGGGHVVNVASALGYWGTSGQLAYVTSKFAVMGYTESLRIELGPTGVGVSAVCPGAVDTGIIETMRLGECDRDGTLRTHLQSLYRRHSAPPERVAAAILRAIRRRQAVVPVTPEAWAMYYVKRWLPFLVAPVTRLVSRYTQHGGVPSSGRLRFAPPPP